MFVTLDDDDIISLLYYQKAKLPGNADKIKKKISENPTFIPLYDTYSENIYLIKPNNVFTRVFRNNYRFPDTDIIGSLKKTLDALKKTNYNDNSAEFIDRYNAIFTKRRINKITLMIEFMASFDMDLLYSAYMRAIYEHTKSIGKNVLTCKRPSFMSHFFHINPYYTREELINIALNMGIITPDDTYYDKDKIRTLCDKVTINDISSSTILEHQFYMVKNNVVGMVQYYTLQGSYFMNQYLRGNANYDTKNVMLEDEIKRVWSAVNNAPAFDKDYTLYRFIHSDKHLQHLSVGDTYIYPSFMSTTRNSLYNPKEYQFGFILLKIKIPKNTPGVALCLESLSNFPSEEEIILSPLSHLHLDAKDNDIAYYHPDYAHVNKITTRYEFTYKGKGDIRLPDKNDVPINMVNFSELETPDTLSMDEKIKMFVHVMANEQYQFKTKIGNSDITCIAEWYNSINAYKDFYSVTTQHGFMIYAICNGNIQFMIEIGEINDTSYMHVNFHERYYISVKNKNYTDDDFITFISSMAYFFGIVKIILYSEYQMIGLDINDKMDDKEITKMIQRCCNYPTDLYNYMKHKKKRYAHMDPMEIKTEFSYYQLDRLRTENPMRILNKGDNDELYQLYHKTFLPMCDEKQNNIADFYIWVVDNVAYLNILLGQKISRIIDNNPFQNDYYVINPGMYLYNKGIIDEYTEGEVSSDKQIKMFTPKNEYRIGREQRETR